ncbi:conserved Plasmodium protein, unknown function [Plasmodium vinckei vinckei]|uniref:Radial spoke head protein 9 homolog n=1 Tax=Plasmodium vinckei vinckei TaxID=54757 RepID=A0A449C0E0_PLAVN|nr:conserved Plasmodium protein, unknown function [Plasmodium vinckei vinckei]KEG04109.1 hypothetical protein YYE_01012 [Plasmodium vinckei vinckei]VEV59092.1 conserved Plasmodium protein, unknown function [Plasmodium vinckei vinckei]
MINLKNLDFHLGNLTESNRCLNHEEKLGLTLGMTNLEEEVKKEIYLWGKIEGIENDYYITYHFKDDDFFPKKVFYYCNDDYKFHELIKGNDHLIEKLERKMPFTLFNGIPDSFYAKGSICKRKEKDNDKYTDETGSNGENSDSKKSEDESDEENNDESDDESGEGSEQSWDDNSPQNGKHEYKNNEINDNNINNDINNRNNKNKNERQNDITELERLSYVIRKIDNETFIIPHDSIKITNNMEMKFSNFSGLNIIDALKLTSWVHFRYPKNLTSDKIKNYNTFFLNNFLDTIKSDIPSNAWNIKINKELNKISIINFLYPGYTFYHTLNTPFYASIYIGNGLSNHDLPFLLP